MEAAKLLRISHPTLAKLAESGEITPLRIGARVLYSRAELARFAEQVSA
jgi:excisionase family DNA binding protein